jgi:hypothetical protein
VRRRIKLEPNSHPHHGFQPQGQAWRSNLAPPFTLPPSLPPSLPPPHLDPGHQVLLLGQARRVDEDGGHALQGLRGRDLHRRQDPRDLGGGHNGEEGEVGSNGGAQGSKRPR